MTRLYQLLRALWSATPRLLGTFLAMGIGHLSGPPGFVHEAVWVLGIIYLSFWGVRLNTVVSRWLGDSENPP